ncbi:MAG: nucleotidyl transferase AbiEii/AbiGii toxin family protein [Gammaproteobacteria bacterium]|jgi:predicted nucleotidyltransferase component of viral defense system
MILTKEIRNLVTKWGLRDSVIEKDYVIGWLLWGIDSIIEFNNYWAFKGGTSIKKCYIDTWRFSEDLDFTVLPNGPYQPEKIKPLIETVLALVHEKSGIDFSIASPTFKYSEKYKYTEGRIYYRGPLNARKPARIKLDINASEKMVHPTELKNISHLYSDSLPQPAQVRCYAFDEIFAEKLRAMGQRGRPRDLYDIVLLFKQKNTLSLNSQLIKSILKQKCATKNISVPTLKAIQTAETKSELIAEWENMLGYQVQTLPPFKQFWSEVPNIFDWLDK